MFSGVDSFLFLLSNFCHSPQHVLQPTQILGQIVKKKCNVFNVNTQGLWHSCWALNRCHLQETKVGILCKSLSAIASNLIELQVLKQKGLQPYLICPTPETYHSNFGFSSFIHFRFHFKILILTFRALHGQAPKYIADLLKVHSSSRAQRSSYERLLVASHDLKLRVIRFLRQWQVVEFSSTVFML